MSVSRSARGPNHTRPSWDPEPARHCSCTRCTGTIEGSSADSGTPSSSDVDFPQTRGIRGVLLPPTGQAKNPEDRRMTITWLRCSTPRDFSSWAFILHRPDSCTVVPKVPDRNSSVPSTSNNETHSTNMLLLFINRYWQLLRGLLFTSSCCFFYCAILLPDTNRYQLPLTQGGCARQRAK